MNGKRMTVTPNAEKVIESDVGQGIYVNLWQKRELCRIVACGSIDGIAFTYLL